MTIRTILTLALLLFASLPTRAQSAPDPTGDWRGTLQAGAVPLRVALHLGETSTFDSPDQGAMGLPARMAVDGRRVTVTINQVGSIEGELSADGKTLTGFFIQGQARVPLTLERGTFAFANGHNAMKRATTDFWPWRQRADVVPFKGGTYFW